MSDLLIKALEAMVTITARPTVTIGSIAVAYYDTPGYVTDHRADVEVNKSSTGSHQCCLAALVPQSTPKGRNSIAPRLASGCLDATSIASSRSLQSSMS
jgi:hypothetical protein